MDIERANIVFCNAKDLAKKEQFKEALNTVKPLKDFAIKNSPFANKLAKFINKIAPFCELKNLKLAYLSSTTTVFIEPLIKAFSALNGISLELKSGDFGNYVQDIINPNSWLSDFCPDIIILATNYKDASLKSICSLDDEKKVVEEISSLWAKLKERFKKLSIIHLNYDLPNFDSAGFLSQTYPLSKVQTLKRISVNLANEAALQDVIVVDGALLQSKIGSLNWEDLRLFFHAKQHPSMQALPYLASEFARAISAKVFPPKKLCILDLDNTLWGGVIAEDLLGGINLGAPDAKGEAFCAFHEYLLGLKNRGILLAVCSKNNEADAKKPFEEHSSCILKLDDFVSFKANWNLKSQNILEMSKELNLGLDSFVFIDDNPIEIQEVSDRLPQVQCVLLPDDSSDFIGVIEDRNFFDTYFLSNDDILRTQTYTQNKARQNAKNSSLTMEDFLASLDMQCKIEQIDSTNLQRVTQLLGKTNQFNLTTYRHSQEEISAISLQENSFAKCFRLSDKYGDNGIVGVLLAKPLGDILDIDTFIMSCRVIGRDLEFLMINWLFKSAKQMNFKSVKGTFIPSEKNAQTKEIFAKFGFKKVEETSDNKNNKDNKTIWHLDVDKYNPKNVPIKIV